MAPSPLGSFRFLGTGASAGIPVVGCSCAVCRSSDPLNRRLRPSGLLDYQGKVFLIDIGPDFRQQALRYGITRLDGVLITHTHFDHIAGIDELRVLNFHQNQPIPCLLSQESFSLLERRYDYLVQKKQPGQPNRAEITFEVLPQTAGQIEFCSVPFRYMSYAQGNMEVTGFRLGRFAYLTDIRVYEEELFSHLVGVEDLVLSSLKPEASKAHFSFEEATAFAARVGAARTWLTHLSHAVDHESASRLLPSNVQLSYDGLTLSFEVPPDA